MIVLVYGPEGSGKTTQAVLLSRMLGIPLVQSGELVRGEIQKKSPIGKICEESAKAGKYVDDDIVNTLILGRLSKEDCLKGFILDGFPRHYPQLLALKKFLDEKNQHIDKVVYITIPEAESIKRLMIRGRADDTPELIRARLLNFHQGAQPILDEYKKEGLVEEIDGTPTIEQIHQEVVKRVRS